MDGAGYTSALEEEVEVGPCATWFHSPGNAPVASWSNCILFPTQMKKRRRSQ